MNINPNFLKGDVVELLNVTSLDEYSFGREKAHSMIGMRFKVEASVLFADNTVRYLLDSEQDQFKQLQLIVCEYQLMLYKRGRTNWIQKIFRR